MLQDLISIGIAAVGAGLVALAVRRARTAGWAGSLQLAAVGFLLIGASAIGVVGFLAGLVLSPLAWLGVICLAIAGVLFVVGQRLEGRSPKATGKVTADGGKRKAVEAKPAAVDDDLAEIEAILRKHGIQ